MILCLTSAAYANSYNYRKRITIDHNRVSSSCTHLDSFPVLIDIQTDPNLKTTAYGGHVFAAAGHDIIFEGAGGGQLDHEVLSYDGSSGSLLAFVRLPQVSSESDTVFYIRYGNSSVSSSQQNVGGVWDSNYDVVLHLQESGNGSSNEYKDSTTNGHHGTGGGLAGAGNPSYTPGRTNGLYGYAQNFDGSNDLIRLDAIEDSTWSAVTVQAWINPNDFGDDRIFGKCWGTGSDDETWLMRKRDGKIGSRMRTNSALNTGFDLAGLGTGSWYLASVTWDASDNKLRVFLNGNELASTDLGGTTMYRYPEVSQPTIGNIPGGGRDYNGQLQEARVSKVARPACWLKTEYNNQNSPSTFYSIGAEEDMTPLYTISAVAGGGGIIMPVGDMIVRSGDDQSFTITAADGYEISDVLVDGISKGVQISWTFPSVTADHNIQVIFAPIAGSSDPGPDTLLNGCGVIDVSIDYNNGFTAGTLDMINTQVDDVTGHVVLNTGFAAIDKENIVIPFDQEVFVNALYIAGRNDLGYSLLEDVVDEYGNFIGFDKIQVAKRHGLFRGTWDGNYDGGDGVFDESYAYGNFPYWSENEISEYDDGTGRPFLVNGDGVVSSRDMRKSLGVIAGGTEIVFWIVQVDRAKRHYDASFYVYDDDDPNPRDHVFFNKRLWNPDWWPSYHPDPECNPGFSPWNKVYQLDGPADEGTCHNPGGWLQLKSHDRLLSEFNLQMSNASHTTLIEDGQRYDHVIVGAPKDDPNQWILGFEQNNIQYITGSDIDCNDVVFKIERKTGGMVELSEANAITTGSADASFTGVTLGVWDYIPCVDDNDISYQLSIDNGINWVDVSNWDEVYESNANKDILGKIENFNWQPGSPAYTYRTRRIDFSGMGLSGHQIRWRANLISTDEVCEPRILDLTVDATVMRDAEVSRAGPVVKANVLYSGSYAIVNSGGAEELRGHLKATRIYDPANPGGGTTGDFLWDAGVKLNDENPSLRKILIPNITVTTITNELVGVGLGPGAEGDENKFFSSTLAYQPVLAESLIISDAHESFIDKHTDVLEGNLGGVGKIDRFSGEFSVEFHTAPNLNVPITASYNHCTTSSDMLDFNSTNVSAEMLDIDDTHVVGKGYIYDFDGNGSFDANADRHWLINWVRGFKDGASVQKDWLLGAIDHSIPALQTPPSLPDWYYGTAITKAERKSFKQFVDENATRRSVLYNGARDGMLHAFDAGAYRHPDSGQCPDGNNRGCFLGEDYGTGEELWAFIPANLIPRLKNNVLQGDDQAYVDGSPALADVYTDSQWRTVLLSAQGNGGDTIFCLDVTNPLDPKFLWEFADPDLFRSRSSPSVGKIGRILVDGEAVWVAFFVSGKTYDATLYPSIYIINIADGSVVKRVMLDSDGSGVGGVPSGQPSIIDSDGNGYIDRLYIGTDKGFLYKVNVPDDPDAVKFEFSNCVINRDFTDTNEPANSVSINQRYHPIYGTPVVIVDNGIGSDGAITYDIKILFGTGDSPYYDEDIDMGNTRYHFFAYRDQAKKGECDNSKVFLDWFLELPEGHRIFASAFSSAGKIYFGTATSETEDPCDGPSTTGLTSRGDLYVMDIATGMQTHKINVGNTVITPIVYDEHLYVKASSAELQSFGSGNYDNEVLQGGFPKVEIKAWREFF
ncbi:MAG: PilC/PilY family type IV pilus protein [Desulfobacterales bacterium]